MEEFYGDVERYDTLSNTWMSLPKLNHPRYDHSSFSIGDNLYVMGGSNYFDYIDSIEKLANAAGPELSSIP